MSLEYHYGGDPTAFGQPFPGRSPLHIKSIFSDVQGKPPVFKSVPVVACPIETKKKEGLLKENE